MAMEVRRVITDAHDASILCVTFNPHRRELITGAQDGHIKMWDNDTGKHTRTLVDGHLGWVTGLAYGSAQRMLFSCSIDSQLIVWDTRNKGEWFQKVKTGGQAHCVAWDNRRQLVLVGGDSVIRMFAVLADNAIDPSRRPERPILKLAATVKNAHEGLVRGISVNESGRVFSAGYDATLTMYDIVDAPQARARTVDRADGAATDLELASGGTAAAKAAAAKGAAAKGAGGAGAVSKLALPSAAGPKPTAPPAGSDERMPILEQRGGALRGHSGAISALAFDGENSLTITGSFDKQVKIWSPEGKLLQTFGPLVDTLTGVCYVPANKSVWVATNSITPVVFDARTGTNITGFVQPPTVRSIVRGVRASGNVPAGTADDEAAALDERGGTRGPAIPAERLLRLFSNPLTNEVVGATSTRDLVIWRFNPHGAASVLSGHSDWVETVCFTHKPELEVAAEPLVVLFSAGSDGTVRQWEPTSRLNAYLYTEAGSSVGHDGPILCGAFCEAANAYVSGSDDCTIRVWYQPTTAQAAAAARAAHGFGVEEEAEAAAATSATAAATVPARAPAAHAPAAGAPGSAAEADAPASDEAGAPAPATDPLDGASFGPAHAAGGAASAFVPPGTAGSTVTTTTLAGLSLVALGLDDHAPAAAPSADELLAAAELAGAAAAAEYVEATVCVLEGHEERVTGLVILGAPSPAGTIVSCSWDLTVRWWQLMPGSAVGYEEVHAIENAHDDHIHGIAYAPSTHQVATCSADQGVKIWDASRYSLVATLSGHLSDVTEVSWNPVFGVWMTGSDDQTIRVWTTLGQELRAIDARDAVSALATDLNHGYLLAACNERQCGLRVYDLGLELSSTAVSAGAGVAGSGERGAEGPGGAEPSAAAAAASSGAAAPARRASAGGALLRSRGSHAELLGVGVRTVGEYFLLQTHYGHTDCIRDIVHVAEKGHYVTASWDHTLRTWRQAGGKRRGSGAPPAARGAAHGAAARRAALSSTVGSRPTTGADGADEEVTMTYADKHPLQKPKALQKDLSQLGVGTRQEGGQAARGRRQRKPVDELLSKSAGQTGMALRLNDLLTDKQTQLDTQMFRALSQMPPSTKRNVSGTTGGAAPRKAETLAPKRGNVRRSFTAQPSGHP